MNKQITEMTDRELLYLYKTPEAKQQLKRKAYREMMKRMRRGRRLEQLVASLPSMVEDAIAKQIKESKTALIETAMQSLGECKYAGWSTVRSSLMKSLR